MGRLRKRVLAAGLVLCGLVLAGCERELRLTIECRDEREQPIPGVRITVAGMEYGDTDEQGTLLAVWKPGDAAEFTVSGRHPDYFPFEKTLRIPEEDDAGFTFVMYERRFLQITCLLEQSGGAERVPLEGAVVVVNERDVGTTNAEGMLRHEFQARLGEVIAVSAFREGCIPVTDLPLLVDVLPGKRVFAQTLVFRPLVEERPPVVLNVRVLDAASKQGVAGVSVLVEDEELGVTDAGGAARFELDRLPGERVRVTLRKSGLQFNPPEWQVLLPEGEEVELLANAGPRAAPGGEAAAPSGGAEVPAPVRAPPRYRLATAVEVTAGPGGAGEVDRWRSIIERELGDFVARTAFLTAVSRSVSPEGWSRRRGVDYLLLAEARLGEEGNRLELSLINPRGQAVVRQAVDAVDSDRLRDRVAELLGALGAGFPVAGSVKRVSGDTVWLNIGKDRILAVGDVFIDRLRRVRVEVSEVADREAQALVRAGRPRVGLQLTRRRMIGFQADSTALYLTVLDDESGESLENAAIYRDGLFCGASDAEGKAAIPVPQDQPYRLEVSKLGYETHDERIRHAEPREHTVRLKLEYCTLQVSSFPTGSQIFLDGVRVGTAPLEIRTTLGIHTLRAVPQDREQFETYRYPGKLILEQPREEIKIVHRGNYLAKARELLPQRRFKEAAELLRHVPRPREGEDPAGYIEAQFELGRLYLDQLQNPRGAIESFRNVIEFDHRYAMAHLNLGLAFYKARDYERAISQLERAKRYKSFFPKDRYEVCVGDALFYRAMAAQKLSELRPGRPGVERACQLWDEFLDFYRRLPAQRRPLLRETYDIAASLEAKNCR